MNNDPDPPRLHFIGALSGRPELKDAETFQPEPGTREIHPDPDDIAEYAKLRRREMESISERLGRLPKIPWSQIWGGIAAIAIGGAVGAALAALQMNPATNKGIYWGIVGGTIALGFLAGFAAYTTHDERADSVRAIKDDLDRLLGTAENADQRQG